MSALVLETAELGLVSKKQKYKVSITAEAISYTECTNDSKLGDAQVVFLKDVIGCDLKENKNKNGVLAYLALYWYPHVKKWHKKHTIRSRQQVTFIFDKHHSYEKNAKDVSNWKNSIDTLLSNTTPNTGACEGGLCNLDKKIWVFVNPFSGRKKAMSMFTEKVEPMMIEAHMNYQVQVTEYANHARELVKKMDLSKCSGIVIVSGDGLIYEVLNGFMDREDWRDALQIPVGALPCGSGNALAAVINLQAGEPYLDSFLLHSSYILTKHIVQPLDLMSVDLCDGGRVYGFLGVAWAIVSDVDIESEKFRALGSLRFTITGISKIMSLKKYRGRLSFLPVEPYVPPHLKKSRSMSLNKHSTSSASIEGLSYRRTQSMYANMTQPDDQSLSSCAEASESEFRMSPGSTPSQLSLVNDTQIVDIQGTDGAVQNGAIVSQPVAETSANSSSGTIMDCSRLDLSSLDRDQLPPLSEPVPDNWVTIEENFVFFTASLLSHLSADTVVAPDASMNDGYIYIGIIREGVSRLDVLTMMSEAAEVKNHGVAYDLVQRIKVKAFRLTPLTNEGIMTVDGERVPYGPIQAHAMPCAARVMCRPT